METRQQTFESEKEKLQNATKKAKIAPNKAISTKLRHARGLPTIPNILKDFQQSCWRQELGLVLSVSSEKRKSANEYLILATDLV